ncbi:hypothetical protein NDU88_006388 [Pleurodeles waltl]|uniref:MHC class I antigen n=1 Tax=Pleurodeles waltl TaxID=8319 RepID=A0AAV7L3I8_PLEWA|nr:hypothetical protein NDU88_006388 [Pleurodeles waltl]
MERHLCIHGGGWNCRWGTDGQGDRRTPGGWSITAAYTEAAGTAGGGQTDRVIDGHLEDGASPLHIQRRLELQAGADGHLEYGASPLHTRRWLELQAGTEGHLEDGASPLHTRRRLELQAGGRRTPGGWSITAAFTEAARTAGRDRGTPGGWNLTPAYTEVARTAGRGQTDTWRMEPHRCIQGGG